MIPIKTEVEIQQMREASRVAANVLDELCELVAPGVTTYELDQQAKKLLDTYGAESACYNYRVGNRVYPAFTCLSVNDEVVHGIGSIQCVLKEGDNITVDVVVSYQGFIGDNARTVGVGNVSAEMDFLVKRLHRMRNIAIDFAKPGNRVGDISHAVQTFVESRNLSIVREFVGHGVGLSMHEEPQIPNFGKKSSGAKLYPGMTLAIEPMVNLGKPQIKIDDDGWTARTIDNKPAAHFEHTVLVTDEGPEILTIPKK